MSDRIERFHYIFNHLLFNNVLSRDNYISEFGLTDRTLQRDMEELRDYFNLTLDYDKSTKVYRITEEDKKKFFNTSSKNKKSEPSERFLNDFIQKYTATIKLFNSISKPEYLNSEEFTNYKEIIYISKYPEISSSVNSDVFEKLLDLTKRLKKISFKYYTKSRETASEVKAVPLLLYFFQNRWYLIAKEYEKDNIIKKYNLDIISEVKELPSPLKISKEMIAQIENENIKLDIERKKLIGNLNSKGSLIHWDAESKPLKTIIRVDKETSYYFKKYNYGFDQKIKINDDGTIDVTFYFSAYLELWFTLSSWIPNIKIIEPEIYKEKFIKDISSFLDKYK